MNDNLDNIERKASARGKQAAPVEKSLPTSNQQISLMNESLSAALQQVAGLQEQFFQVVRTNELLVNEVLGLKKAIRAQHQVYHEMLNYLDYANSSTSNQSFHSSGLPGSADEPLQELRRSLEILTNTASVLDAPAEGRELERQSLAFQSVASPPESTTSSAAMFNQSSPAVVPMVPDSFSDMKHLVYPIGPLGVNFEQAGGPAAPHGPQLKFETAGPLHPPSIKFEPAGSMHFPMDGAGGGYMAAGAHPWP